MKNNDEFKVIIDLQTNNSNFEDFNRIHKISKTKKDQMSLGEDKLDSAQGNDKFKDNNELFSK